MDRSLRALSVPLGGRVIQGAGDLVSRYCGLEWSGGGPETWAFRYYDAIPSTLDNTVTPVDVVAAAALHPGLTKADLAFFVDEAEALSSWLGEIPVEATVNDHAWRRRPGDDRLTDHVGSMVRHAADGAVNFALLTKVMHRKRPQVVPLVDRHIVDWYRPLTGSRSAVDAYPEIVARLASDVAGAAGEPLDAMRRAVEVRTGVSLSVLRVADILLWMGGMR